MTNQTTLTTSVKSWNNEEQPAQNIDARIIIEQSSVTLIASVTRPNKTTSTSSIMLENSDGHPAFRIYHDSETDSLIGTISEITKGQSENCLKATFEQAIKIDLTGAQPYPTAINSDPHETTTAKNKPGHSLIMAVLSPWDSTADFPKLNATIDIQEASITLSTIFSRQNESKGQISIMLENDCGTPKFRIYHDSETDELIGTLNEKPSKLEAENHQLELNCAKQIAIA